MEEQHCLARAGSHCTAAQGNPSPHSSPSPLESHATSYHRAKRGGLQSSGRLWGRHAWQVNSAGPSAALPENLLAWGSQPHSSQLPQAAQNGTEGLHARWHQTGFQETALNFPTNGVIPVLSWSFPPAHPWVSARPWCIHLVVPPLPALCTFSPFSFAKKTINKTKTKKKKSWEVQMGISEWRTQQARVTFKP